MRRFDFAFYKIFSSFVFELNQVCHQQVVKLWVLMDSLWAEEHRELDHTKYLIGNKPSIGIEHG